VAFAQSCTDGSPVHPAKPTPTRRTTSVQFTQRRNLLWLRAMEVGMTDPITGQVRPYSARELAGLWRTSVNLITTGTTRARRIRQRCHDAMA
jgi:hypothetical protein